MRACPLLLLIALACNDAASPPQAEQQKADTIPAFKTGYYTTGQEKMLLLPDHNYYYMSENSAQVNGKWQVNSNEVQLLLNDSIYKRIPVNSLTRKDLADDNKAWSQKKAAGVDFIALGTEPFWSLEIDKDKLVSFTRMGDSKATVFPYMAPTGQYTYNVQNDSAKLQIIITPQFCSDGMSDNWYEYKVDLNYNGTKFSGCGVKLNGL